VELFFQYDANRHASCEVATLIVDVAETKNVSACSQSISSSESQGERKNDLPSSGFQKEH
jgi:hypothetical protein